MSISLHDDEIELVQYKVDKSMTKEYFEDINKVLKFASELSLNMASHFDEENEVFSMHVCGYNLSKKVA